LCSSDGHCWSGGAIGDPHGIGFFQQAAGVWWAVGPAEAGARRNSPPSVRPCVRASVRASVRPSRKRCV